MNDDAPVSRDEAALAAFLHDVGKFMQRAHRTNGDLDAAAMARAPQVLPGFFGRSSHWHALWTDAFFAAVEASGAAPPAGMRWARVREAAARHHDPRSPAEWIVAEANRIAAGLERKPRDEEAEDRDPGGASSFRGLALRGLFASIAFGGTPPAPRHHLAAAFAPAALAPGNVGEAAQAIACKRLWPGFLADFVELCAGTSDPATFHRALLALSERFTWAIPSSPHDQPDVSLHAHAHTAAAVAACLHGFHAARGELGDLARIRDRAARKFRFVVGSLGGAEGALSRRGPDPDTAPEIIRRLQARALLMDAALGAAAQLVCRALDLPAYCELVLAGERFVLLVPDLPDLDPRLDGARRALDLWACARHRGDLSIDVAAAPAMSAQDLMQGGYERGWGAMLRAAEGAALSRLSTLPMGALADEAGTAGPCPACALRPAWRSGADGRMRCAPCDDEAALAAILPDVVAALWTEGSLPADRAARQIDLPAGLSLALLTVPLHPGDAESWERVRGGWRIDDGPAPAALPLATRLVARRGAVPAQGMLAVLRADMDRVGQIFGRWLGKDRSLGRIATLSRMIDAFFSVAAPALLAQDFPDLALIQGGGDALAVVGACDGVIRFAQRLEEAFRVHTGDNPHLGLSAAIEIARRPDALASALRRAATRVEAAKAAGRDRIAFLAPAPIDWPAWRAALAAAARLDALLAAGRVSRGLLVATYDIAQLRRRAEGDGRGGALALDAADWRARWARSLDVHADRGDGETLAFLDGLLGGGLAGAAAVPPPPGAGEAALAIALLRNR
jgi:CRISPR-associated protein Csm1